jgi:Cyclin, N-terminal domain
MNSEQIISTIAAMCHQEEHGYSCSDYLHTYNNVVPGPNKSIAVDGEVRTKLVEWCYSIVDFCKFNRETVAIAISYLDRFLLSELGLVTLQEPTIYQLAAMTSLYTAIKIHEPEAMDPELVSNLSHGAYTIEQVEAMEFAILQAIDWRVNPPTALAFVSNFLDLLPNRVLDKATKSAAYDLTINQTEVAVRDYKFVTVNASTVAYVSLMNSLESLCVDSKTYDYVSRILAKVSNVDSGSARVLEMHKYLYPHVSDHQSVDETHHHRAAAAGQPQKAASPGSEAAAAKIQGVEAPKKALDHRAKFYGLSPCSTFETFPSRP